MSQPNDSRFSSLSIPAEFLQAHLDPKTPPLSLPSLAMAKIAAVDLHRAKIAVSDLEGALIRSLVRLKRCSYFLEIGTLTGISAHWIVSAMQPGVFTTIEKNSIHFDAGAPAFEKLARTYPEIKLERILGDASVVLQNLKGPVDGVFIDGDKSGYGSYLDWVVSQMPSGGLLIADNVFLGGLIWGEKDPRFSANQARKMNEFINKAREHFDCSFIPTSEGMLVGVKK
jgi:predicted O-methyltransferase YrrM